jgi:hypothetical protein
MRLTLLLPLAFACCASRPKLELPDPDAPPSMWKARHHPVTMLYGSGTVGNLSYGTKGTAASRDDRTDARLHRFGFLDCGGIMLDFVESDGLSGGTEAEAFDIFTFGNLPLWPNKRLRFMSRPGAYFNKINLVGTRMGDVEPWSWGLRYELEAEVDLVKKPKFIVSLYASGRIRYGWGRAKITGVTEDINALGWGYEAGAPAHLHNWMVALSWIDRTMDVDSSFSARGAEYRFEGASLTIGTRW